ncbi:FAD-dependent monooxygenase [Chondromyces apiculatus]|uniref:FAD-dependent monooxygenase n=1 Tax=Chondromyces apiculatus DSM 436 TaxID=1192034 RepID=A0A017SYM3_9BACT|nr:FAD-dependent monooxygenase [Chondromyces apiculatus]EYF01411.1 FAD-dependent monooxygenase [Chondromyces apiculatus DSM 436]
MRRYEADVAVAGGGPVGLMVACELALSGMKVAVFERRVARVEQSRALTLHPRSLEILALRGLVERFRERGHPIPVAHYAALDTRLDLSALDSSFRFTLFIPQALTEALLEARALELGVDLHRGHLVTGVGEGDGAVEVEGTCGGDTFAVKARALVGADGARSAVRKLAGIPFPGTEATASLMLGDVVLTEPPPSAPLSALNTGGNLLLVPLGDGVHHRLVVVDPERLDVPLSEPVTLEELSRATRKIVGTDFGMTRPFWLSRFGNETRQAATYREGWVFLAGDAAHVHLPAGGQGLNVGLQDAMNLGWKLAGVLRGLAPASLLDTYQEERHPVGARLLQDTLSQTALLLAFDPAGLALRATLSRLLTTPEANRMLAAQISGCDVVYPDPVLPAPPGMEVAPGLTGRRLPRCGLRLEDGAEVSPFTLFREGRWVLLRRPGTHAPALPEPWARWTSVVTATVDGGGEGLQGWSSILLRPDGRVGYVARDLRSELVDPRDAP